ncbi:MAG: response regulator [Elusimicrobia bacterium]|nr:response regulator [Elusimicrobiota bacterium]
MLGKFDDNERKYIEALKKSDPRYQNLHPLKNPENLESELKRNAVINQWVGEFSDKPEKFYIVVDGVLEQHDKLINKFIGQATAPEPENPPSTPTPNGNQRQQASMNVENPTGQGNGSPSLDNPSGSPGASGPEAPPVGTEGDGPGGSSPGGGGGGGGGGGKDGGPTVQGRQAQSPTGGANAFGGLKNAFGPDKDPNAGVSGPGGNQGIAGNFEGGAAGSGAGGSGAGAGGSGGAQALLAQGPSPSFGGAGGTGARASRGGDAAGPGGSGGETASFAQRSTAGGTSASGSFGSGGSHSSYDNSSVAIPSRFTHSSAPPPLEASGKGGKEDAGGQREGAAPEESALTPEELAQLKEIQDMLKQSAEQGSLDAEALGGAMEKPAAGKEVEDLRESLKDIVDFTGRPLTPEQKQKVMSVARDLGFTYDQAKKLIFAVEHGVPAPAKSKQTSLWETLRRLAKKLRHHFLTVGHNSRYGMLLFWAAMAAAGLCLLIWIAPRTKRSRLIIEAPPPPPPSRRILCVMRDASDREAVAVALSHEGYEVHRASDWREGREQALSLSPDLVVADAVLPISQDSAKLAVIVVDKPVNLPRLLSSIERLLPRA